MKLDRIMIDGVTYLIDTEIEAYEAYYNAMQHTVWLYDNATGSAYIVPRGKTSVDSSDGLGNYKLVVLPNGLETIGYVAFANTFMLKKLAIPPTTKKIDEYAFYYCTGLESLHLPDSVVEIGNQAFQNCTALTEFVFGNGIKKLGKNIFYECSSLKTVTLPNSLDEIGDNSFCRWTGLTHIEIPNSVKRIGNSAFQNCYGLTRLSLLAYGNDKTFPTLGTNAFANILANNSSFRIVVPDGRKEDLASMTNWSVWKAIMVEG